MWLLSWIHNQLIKASNKAVIKSMDYLKEKVIEKTPTDTKKLLSNHKVTIDWLNGKITNDTEYAENVEFWVNGVYNYHKWPPRWPSTRFYSWTWVRMMSRTKDEEEWKVVEIFRDIITKELWT